MQTTQNILLIRPSNFIFNPETEESNAFQVKIETETDVIIKRKALNEFELLGEINEIVLEDSKIIRE